MHTKNNTIEIVSRKADHSARCEKIIAEIKKATLVDFTLALGATALSDIEGVSAAGASPASRRLTPKLDAEALVSGRTAKGEPLPSSPVGVTSPVVVTRACLSLVKHQINIVDCGTFVPPEVEHTGLGSLPGQDISQTNSMSIEQVQELYRRGNEMAQARYCEVRQNSANGENSWPENLAQDKGAGMLPVLAECVPGGTTTALAVLKALGFEADNLLSSSVPGKRLTQAQIVKDAFRRLDGQLGAGKLQSLCAEDPLLAVACLGDPMQAFAAGFALGALKALALKDKDKINSLQARARAKAVVLAGGSQMLALYALIKALAKSGHADLFFADENLAPAKLIDKYLIVATTQWVAHDPFGNTQALAEIVEAPFAAARIDFSRSRHSGLRAYEDGHVKEGVGAGASLLLAGLLGSRGTAFSAADDIIIEESMVLATIDHFYDKMVLDGS